MEGAVWADLSADTELRWRMLFLLDREEILKLT